MRERVPHGESDFSGGGGGTSTVSSPAFKETTDMEKYLILGH